MSLTISGNKACYIVQSETSDPIVFTNGDEANKVAKILSEEDGEEYKVVKTGLDPIVKSTR